MTIAVFGYKGKMGSITLNRLRESEYSVVGIEREDQKDLGKKISECSLMIDFTSPEAVLKNVAVASERKIDCVIGTSGFKDYTPLKQLADKHKNRIVLIPNFSISLTLILKAAREMSSVFNRSYIVEEHGCAKKDMPSQTSIETARQIGVSHDNILSLRSLKAVARQEIVFSSDYETVRLDHKSCSRDGFLPGIVAVVDKLHADKTNYSGFTVGLEHFL